MASVLQCFTVLASLCFLSFVSRCEAKDVEYSDEFGSSLRQHRSAGGDNGKRNFVLNLEFHRPLKSKNKPSDNFFQHFSDSIHLPETLDLQSFLKESQLEAPATTALKVKAELRGDFEPVQRITDSGQDPLATKLRIAIILRDNLVNVFGYILYQTTKSLDLNKYASLMDIYKGLHLRRVRTVELLPYLPDIAYKSPQEQFQTVFNVLNETRPLYLMGATEVWLRAVSENKVDLNAILRPQGGALVADLFSGIDLGFMAQLQVKSHFTNRAMDLAPPQIKSSMGPFFGNIFGGIIEGSIILTRQLVALLMLHTQLYQSIAEVEEALRYLVDVMLLRESSQLEFAVQNIDPVSKASPYSLVNKVLTNLVQAKSVDPAVKECAEIILPHFLPLNLITLNPNYNNMLDIVKTLHVNFEVLFKFITPGDYPDDVVKTKDMLLVAIFKKELNMGPIMQGFVIHDYFTPSEMIIAVLDRIWRRGRNTIPQYLISSLRALIVHVKMRYASSVPNIKPLQSLNDIKYILYAFFTPQVSDGIKMLVKEVLKGLSVEAIPWQNILQELRPSESSRPKHFIRRLFLHLLTSKLVTNQTLIQSISSFISLTDSTGEAKDCPIVECVGNNAVPQVTTPPPVLKPQPTPTRTLERKTIGDVDVRQLFSAIFISGQEVPRLLKLTTYVNNTLVQFFPTFDPIAYKTSGELLKALFQKYVTHPEVLKYQDIVASFKLFYPKIQTNGIGARPVPWTDGTIIKKIDMTNILKALNAEKVELEGKADLLDVLYEFLLNDYRVQDYSAGFQFQVFISRGAFLGGFFRHIINYPGINPKVRDAFKALEPYIQMDGPGGAPVDVLN